MISRGKQRLKDVGRRRLGEMIQDRERWKVVTVAVKTFILTSSFFFRFHDKHILIKTFYSF